ncbi:hypothetical protein [Streptomyces sp. NPDC050564]
MTSTARRRPVRPENRALDSWVLSEQDGAWRVRGFHNCPEHTA